MNSGQKECVKEGSFIGSLSVTASVRTEWLRSISGNFIRAASLSLKLLLFRHYEQRRHHSVSEGHELSAP